MNNNINNNRNTTTNNNPSHNHNHNRDTQYIDTNFTYNDNNNSNNINNISQFSNSQDFILNSISNDNNNNNNNLDNNISSNIYNYDISSTLSGSDDGMDDIPIYEQVTKVSNNEATNMVNGVGELEKHKDIEFTDDEFPARDDSIHSLPSDPEFLNIDINTFQLESHSLQIGDLSTNSTWDLPNDYVSFNLNDNNPTTTTNETPSPSSTSTSSTNSNTSTITPSSTSSTPTSASELGKRKGPDSTTSDDNINADDDQIDNNNNSNSDSDSNSNSNSNSNTTPKNIWSCDFHRKQRKKCTPVKDSKPISEAERNGIIFYGFQCIQLAKKSEVSTFNSGPPKKPGPSKSKSKSYSD